MKTIYIGEFSQDCAEKYGSVIWLDNNGKEVEVTCAYPSGDHGSGWKDKQIVSANLSHYLRPGRKGTAEPRRWPTEPEEYYGEEFYEK